MRGAPALTQRRGGYAGGTGTPASGLRGTLADLPFVLSPVLGLAAACPCLLVACWLEEAGQAPPPISWPRFSICKTPTVIVCSILWGLPYPAPAPQKETEGFSLQLYRQQHRFS